MYLRMNTYMEKNKEAEYEAYMAKILKDKDKIIEAVRNSPFFKRKHDEAVEQLSKLQPPFPWDDDRAQKKD